MVKDLEMRKSSNVIQMDPKCHHSKRETEGGQTCRSGEGSVATEAETGVD